MKITPIDIQGAAIVEIEPLEDDRGFFARSYCRDAFKDVGLDLDIVQSNLSHNTKSGTLRGLHFQASPKPDPKLVSCIQGKIFDVVVDVREGSDTYRQWHGVELTADNHTSLFVPPGCAHGFITLSDNALVQYQMGEVYVPDLARGVRWDDPAFNIAWPIQPTSIADRDAAYPNFVKTNT